MCRLVRCRLLLLAILPACALTPFARADAAGDLGKAIKGKQFVLRNYDGDREVRFSLQDGQLRATLPYMHAFAEFIPEKTRLKKGVLSMEGRSLVLTRDTKTGTLQPSASSRHVVVSVDLGPADPSATLPTLPSLLFYPTIERALANVPADVRPFVVGERSADDGKASGKVEPPKLISAPGPEYSEEARNRKVSGSCQFALRVATNGHVSDVWLLRALGAGLDEAGLRAVQQYRFQPATKDGEPVATTIFVDVNFQIF